jgi:hypothetical protein
MNDDTTDAAWAEQELNERQRREQETEVQMQSREIDKLAGALAKAQAGITGALKDSANPFFKSKYADLASCWDACRKQLTENELSVIQTTEIKDGEVVVVTTLAHSSGQWIRGILPVKVKDDGPQAQGSGITYARRYALAAIVGLAQIDDDAEAAQGRNNGTEGKRPDTRKVNEYAKRITEAAGKDNLSALSELVAECREAGDEFWSNVWTTLGAPVKNYIKSNLQKAA